MYCLPLQVIEPISEGFRVDVVLCQHAVVHVRCHGRYIAAHGAAHVAARAHLTPLAGVVEDVVQNARQRPCRPGAQVVIAARRL